MLSDSFSSTFTFLDFSWTFSFLLFPACLSLGIEVLSFSVYLSFSGYFLPELCLPFDLMFSLSLLDYWIIPFFNASLCFFLSVRISSESESDYSWLSTSSFYLVSSTSDFALTFFYSFLFLFSCFSIFFSCLMATSLTASKAYSLYRIHNIRMMLNVLALFDSQDKRVEQ